MSDGKAVKVAEEINDAMSEWMASKDDKRTATQVIADTVRPHLSPPAPGTGFDAEAIRPDWLITNGFERSIVIGRYEKPFPGRSWDGYWLTWDDGGAVGISKDSLCVLPVKANTRGELIRLCTALGIPIPPAPNERNGDK